MLPHIYLALPCYRQVEPHFMGSLLNVVRRLHSMESPPFNLKIEIGIGDSIVGRARNRLAARFLATDCTHLMFIDTDVVFTFSDIYLLLNGSIAEKVPSVTCGAVAMKSVQESWTFERGDKEQRASGLVSVPRAGTGFMLIHRKVLEDTRELRPDIGYDADPGDIAGWNFFFAHVNAEGRFIGEDYAFCEMVRALGFPVFLHPAVKIGQVGPALYPLPCSPTKVPA